MSTPFPLEDAAELDSNAAPQWNPWQGQPRPHWYSGMGFNEDTAYMGPFFRVLEAAGQGAAKGEALMAGVWHAEDALGSRFLGKVPVVGEYERRAENWDDTVAQDAAARVKALTPDPATLGSATQTMMNLVSGGYRVVAGSLGGGPVGGALALGGSEAQQRYQELRGKGVGAGTAAASAGLAGVASGAGALLPMGFGGSLLSRLLTGAGENAGFGLADRYADHKILAAGGYKAMADQQQVWDGTQLATDLLLGAGFGGLSHLHAQASEGGAPIPSRETPGAEDAALTANLALRDRASAPGVAVDPASAGAHQAALETATADLLSGKPVDVGASGVDQAQFLSRPTPELGDVQSLLVGALHDGGVLEQEANLQRLEQTLQARLRGENASAEETPSVQESTQTPASTLKAPTEAPLGMIASSAMAAEIPRAKDLTAPERAIETRFAEAMGADYEGMKARYAQLPDAEGGKVLNVDTARELSPDYAADRSQSAAVHEPASWFIKRLYAERLAQAPGPGEEPLVVITGGGTGAGKSTAVRTTLGNLAQRAQIVYDTNLNGVESGITKVDQALAAGKNVVLPYVHREPVESLTHGALTRAMRMEAEKGSGRTVPISEHVKTHVGANQAIRKIAAHYANDNRVLVRVIDNTHGKNGARLMELANLPPLDYNNVREKASAALEEAHAAGRISERVYRGFRGGEPQGAQSAQSGTAAPALPEQLSGIRASAGAGSGGQPEPQRAGQRSDQLTERVATATGRTLEVRPRLVEAADLLTSDREGYPAELQPRQRAGRVALAEQVRSIAQNLEPSRLGSSPEADRGAPITGPGNVVESGNGRVMALREAYANDAEKAAAYRHWLQSQGYDAAGMKEPVLVRERLTPMSAEEQRAFAVEANQAATAALSPVERAQADARLLDGGILSQLRNGELATGANAPFVRAFLERLPQAERNALVNPDGTVSQEGVRRLQAAILAKAYGGAPESNVTLGRMLESTEADMRSTLGAMLDAAPAFARLRQGIDEGKIGPEYDLSRALTQAVEAVAQVRDSGQALNEFLKQEDFLTRRPPVVDTLMRALYDKKGERMAGREKVATTLMDYADRAIKQRLDQGTLFGDAPLPPDRLLETPESTEERQLQPGADMFGLRTSQGGSAAAATAAQALEANPNLEIAGENGQANRARAELLAADEGVVKAAERAPSAIDAAATCFGRRVA